MTISTSRSTTTMATATTIIITRSITTKNIITMRSGTRSTTIKNTINRSTTIMRTITNSIDREINPHHLTDYRYRLPPAIDSPDVASVSSFTAIIPAPIGLPDMYYPNAWDLPDDPRKAHPTLPMTLLVIEVAKENSPVPSGKGRPVFPWEANGSSPAKSPRTPSRTYYNFAIWLD
ncbi:hypothetical protein BGZ82_011801 [Podila clonocystis]|nr:hypothetical protein BGZ82_011801 [Podila clonocystis]